jgi:hypothetical protein
MMSVVPLVLPSPSQTIVTRNANKLRMKLHIHADEIHYSDTKLDL